MTRMLAAVVLLLVAAPGCRGATSPLPPFHLFDDMDWQPRYHPEGESALFADGRSMRPPVEGTIAFRSLHDDDPFFTGKEPGTETFVRRAPAEITSDLRKSIVRGQDRFNIFCAPCHDQTGGGKGLVIARGFFPPIDLTSDHTRGLPDGELFNIVSKGVRNMPSYGYQVPVEDRWAIITWVRVLQRAGHAGLADVPADRQASIQPEGGK